MMQANRFVSQKTGSLPTIAEVADILVRIFPSPHVCACSVHLKDSVEPGDKIVAVFAVVRFRSSHVWKAFSFALIPSISR
jgi:hypothetical protein